MQKEKVKLPLNEQEGAAAIAAGMSHLSLLTSRKDAAQWNAAFGEKGRSPRRGHMACNERELEFQPV
jgi:hypothetical protein